MSSRHGVGAAGLILIALAAVFVPRANAEEVAVVNIGWHTGIALRSADIDSNRIPEASAFRDFAWIEFGWGDADFYRDPDPAIATYLSAAFIRTPAVMHLAGFHAPPQDVFVTSDVLELDLTSAEFARLQDYISASFRRGGGIAAKPLGHGLYPASLFYDAEGSFSLLNTCNSWVARGFKRAGLDLPGEEIILANSVMSALRRAERIRLTAEADGS